MHPILKQQQSHQHHDINANGIPPPLFSSSFSPFSSLQHSPNSLLPVAPHLPVPAPQPTHPFSYNPLSMAAAAVAHHKSLQHANNLSFESSSSNPNIENCAPHKSAFFPASSVSVSHPGLTAAAALYRSATSSLLQTQHQNSFSQYTPTSNENTISQAAVLAAATLRDVNSHAPLFPTPPPNFAPLYLSKELGHQSLPAPTTPFGIDPIKNTTATVEPPKDSKMLSSSNIAESSVIHSPTKTSYFKPLAIQRNSDQMKSNPSDHSLHKGHYRKRSPSCTCIKENDLQRYVIYVI